MTTTDPPKVTVFIPVYNREHYIGEAIESILAQNFPDFELLLVDDGSTDRSVEIMRSYGDARIRVVCNEHNLGIPQTRNRGLELARGPYIALLDSDDQACPGRLIKQVTFLDQHPDYVQVGGRIKFMDKHGQPLKKKKRQPSTFEDIQAQLLFRCCLTNVTVMARTAILQEYRYRESFLRCQDYDMHVRLTRHYKMANFSDALTRVRVHPGQITAQTPELGDTKKREIVSGQLVDLGVAFRQEDLIPHLTLSRMRKFRFTPDHAYLDWADAWLQSLIAANRKTQRYSASVFQRTVSAKWAKACQAAANGMGGTGGMGWTAWQRFLRSPLRKGIASLILRELRVLSRR